MSPISSAKLFEAERDAVNVNAHTSLSLDGVSDGVIIAKNNEVFVMLALFLKAPSSNIGGRHYLGKKRD